MEEHSYTCTYAYHVWNMQSRPYLVVTTIEYKQQLYIQQLQEAIETSAHHLVMIEGGPARLQKTR